MGQFTVKVTLVHPMDPTRQAEVELLVDTGATLSWVPREVVDKIGAPRIGRTSLRIADGRMVERETSVAIFRLDGATMGSPCIIAEPGDGHLLGATTLEALGLGVDPISKRLFPQSLLAM